MSQNPAVVTNEQANKYALAFLFLTSLMDSIGFGIIMPILPGLLMEISGDGLSAAAIYGGWLTFVFALMQFLCAPLIGNLSDRYGRRPVLLVSLFVVGLNYFIMGVAGSLVALFIGRMISGAASSTTSTCNAYIADITPVEKRAQSFGLIGAGFGMGFVIGPVIGGLLGDFGPRVPFFAAGIVSFLNMAFGFFVLRESLPLKNRRKLDLRRANPIGTLLQLKAFPLVIGIMIVMFIYNMGHHVLPSIWSFHAIEKFAWTPREIGYSLGFIGILMVLVQGFLIRWVLPRTGLRWAGIIGMSFTMVAFLGYSFAYQSWMMYVAMIPGALGALTGPAMQGIASAQVGQNQQGELQGGLTSMMSLTSIISPLLMTQAFGFFTSAAAPIYFPGASFLLAALLTLMAVLIFVRITSTVKP